MKVAAVIAEYNPFHNGHRYQLDYIKNQLQADYIIVVMSGNFVQRGVPAILDKTYRTQMALYYGADAVFELPVCYATSSAEFFARGSIRLLSGLNVITHLCFGSECGNLDSLTKIAEYLVQEPEEYKLLLKQYLKRGETFPKARNLALIELASTLHSSKEDLNNLMSSPNNILGIEYIKAILEQKSSIQPITIKREGASYHSMDQTLYNASASAIRNHILNNDVDSLKQIPDFCKKILTEQLNKTYPITANDFSILLFYTLLQHKGFFEHYQDVSSELANRIDKSFHLGLSFDEFTMKLKTKQITLTSVSRSLLHILLGMKQQEFAAWNSSEAIYARLLGLRKENSLIIRLIQEASMIPIITKPADGLRINHPTIQAMFNLDNKACNLYRQTIFSLYKTIISDDLRTSPVIL